MQSAALELIWLPYDAEGDLELFVRRWHGQLGSTHLILLADDAWITVRVTRDSLPKRLRRGPYFTVTGGNA